MPRVNFGFVRLGESKSSDAVGRGRPSLHISPEQEAHATVAGCRRAPEGDGRDYGAARRADLWIGGISAAFQRRGPEAASVSTLRHRCALECTKNDRFNPEEKTLDGGLGIGFAVAKAVLPTAVRTLFIEYFVANWAHKQASAQGIQVSRKLLRRAIAPRGSRRQAGIGAERMDPGMERRILELNATGRDETEAGSILVHQVRLGFLRFASQADANVALAQRFDRSSDAARAFDSNLARLSPVLRREAVLLRSTHGGVIERIVARAASSNGAGWLRDWTRVRPDWLPDESASDGFLALLALDRDDLASARHWATLALDAGASPRAYWLVRLAALGAVDIPRLVEESAGHPLGAAFLQRTPAEQRVRLLESYEPGSPGEASLAAQLLATAYRDSDQLDLAVEYGFAQFDAHGHYGAALVAVEVLLRRSFSRNSRVQSVDLTEALQRALAVRRDRRATASSSGAVVALAMQAAALLADPERSKRLGTCAPGGEATAQEASHPDVLQALVSLGVELPPGALGESDDVPVPRRGLELQGQASASERRGDYEQARLLWAAAVDETDDWNLKTSICLHLAAQGVLHPFVETLSRDNAVIAEEISDIAAMASGDRGAEERVFVATSTSRRLALAYIQHLRKSDRLSELVVASESAAERWGDADLWLLAATTLARQGDFLRAADRAHKALQLGGDDWGDRYHALVVVLENAFRNRDWASARTTALAMLAERQGDVSARWALVLSAFWSGDLATARQELLQGELLEPSDLSQIEVWFEFYRRDPALLGGPKAVRRLAQRFSTEERVQQLAIGALLLGPQLANDGSQELQQVLSSYRQRFPDGQAFKQLDLAGLTPSEMVASLEKAMGDRSGLKEAESLALAGQVPRGVLSLLHRRGYLETLILLRKVRRPRVAVDFERDVRHARQARRRRVIADTSALMSIAQLPATMQVPLLRLYSVASASLQAVDAGTTELWATQTEETIFVPAADGGTARLVETPREELDERASVWSRVNDLFALTERVDVIAVPEAFSAELGESRGQWSASLEVALSSGSALWSDDPVVRALAEHFNAPAFGTAAVVEALRRSGDIDSELADGLDAALLHSWHIEVPLRPSVLELALALDGCRARGVAAAIASAPPDDAERLIESALRAAAEVSEEPDELTGWARAMLALVTPEPLARAEVISNGAKILARLLEQGWAQPSTAPFVVAAVSELPLDVQTEVIESGFLLLARRVERDSDVAIAAQHAFAMSALLDDDQRQVVRSAILRWGV